MRYGYPAIDKLMHLGSRSALARLLAQAGSHYPRRGTSPTQSSTCFTHQSPVRTFADWDETVPGYSDGPFDVNGPDLAIRARRRAPLPFKDSHCNRQPVVRVTQISFESSRIL